MTRPEIAWKVLTLRCVEAARLMSESLDRPTPAHDRLAVRLHILICVSCRRYRRQLLALRRATTRMAGQADPPAGSLPVDVRERIKRALKSG